MQLLQQFHPAAVQYLQGIPPQTWVTALYPGPQYGHKTSNVVESMNKVFKETQELPILELFWHYVMNHRFQRLNKALACETLHTPWCYENGHTQMLFRYPHLHLELYDRQMVIHLLLIFLLRPVLVDIFKKIIFLAVMFFLLFLHFNLVYQTILPLVTIFLNSFFHKPSKRHIFLIFLLSLLWTFPCHMKFLLQRKKERYRAGQKSSDI